MITLLNMIFANPIAYLIFPNMVNTYNTSTTTEYAVYSGYLNLYNDIVTDNRLFEIFNCYTREKGAFALYSLILFNRTLTPEEIEWVKTNYLQSNT